MERFRIFFGKRSSVFLCFLVIFGSLSGQTGRDTLNLPEFEITSGSVIDHDGFKRMRMDSLLFLNSIGGDLGTIISQHSTIFIKSYGPGTLATPSFRGTAAQHTQVEWNGISLNSPMLGQMDFSQVPVSQFDGLEIYYGAAGISRTSGAFGGVIDLVTKPDWQNRTNILLALQGGSFSTWSARMNVAAGNNDLQINLKCNINTSKNDFPFYITEDQKVKQINAGYQQAGVSQDIFWKIKDKNLFSVKVWYSQDDRKLPPTTQTYDSLHDESINDKNLRGIFDYKFLGNNWNFLIRTAVNDQYMIYSNNDPPINSAHHSTSWINRLKFNYSGIRKLTIRPGIDFTYDEVRSNDYLSGFARRSTFSLYADMGWDVSQELTFTLVLRNDFVDGTAGKLIPALGIKYRPVAKANLDIIANLSRNYRFPTLNDLYWNNQGVSTLKPETSYTAEAGTSAAFSLLKKQLKLEPSLSGYYSRIYDMIAWYPVAENGGLFSPENVDEILARGLEAALNLHALTAGFGTELNANYNFCRSTYEKVSSGSDLKKGKQQIYIPVHTLNVTAMIERWNFYLKYNFTYVSDRYTSRANEYIMPGYSLSNFILGKNLRFNQNILSLQLDINNIFNLDYQSVASRPMPGISWLFSVKYRFDRREEN